MPGFRHAFSGLGLWDPPCIVLISTIMYILVQFDFANCTTFTINYQTVGRGAVKIIISLPSYVCGSLMADRTIQVFCKPW